MLRVTCSSLFSPHFCFSHHFDKCSSLSHLSINLCSKTLYWPLQTLILPFYIWCWSEVCILLCSICNSVSKSPVDSRWSEHHPSFLEVVGDFTDMYFRVHFHNFYDLPVINCCCFSQLIRSLLVADVSGGLQTLNLSMPFVFAIALIDFLFSFSIQIACFSLKVSSLVFILLCVWCHWMQDSECRSNGYNWYDTFPAFNIWRINATGHSWSLRKTCEATVPILVLISDSGMNSKSAYLLSWLNIYVLKHPIIKCDIL